MNLEFGSQETTKFEKEILFLVRWVVLFQILRILVLISRANLICCCDIVHCLSAHVERRIEWHGKGAERECVGVVSCLISINTRPSHYNTHHTTPHHIILSRI